MNTPFQLSELINQVGQEFEIRHKTLCFDGHSIDCCQPADPESILDDETLLRSHGELDWQPYWAQAWDASLGMCHYLNRLDLAEKRVLDLGCGIGLTSATLLACGANVTCGDNAPPSLAFAKINTWPWRDRCDVQLIDWHQTKLDGRFELIIGSDIVYERIEVKPLDGFFRCHLVPGGKVILGDPSRPMTRDFLEAFRSLGWNQREESVHVENVKQLIRIITMTL